MHQKPLKVGIIGSGFAANFHFKALKRVYGAQLDIVGAYSINKVNLDLFTMDKAIKSFPSLDGLITAADVLHVCTPPSTHEQLVIEILSRDRHAIVEKPFTGYFGPNTERFDGDTFPRAVALAASLKSIERMLEAESASKGRIFYAENWIYAPSVQKEKEIIETTGAQILWIQAQQSHSGSHSPDYGKWSKSGGGSLIGKGSHPLAAAIYLKKIEGLKRNGKPLRPLKISARTHSITRLPGFIDKGHLKKNYTDVEDYANVHIIFQDGTIADITASELTHGGVRNYLEVNANNHRSICNIAPNNAMQTYNPLEEAFNDIYVVEKTGTKQGWSNISPEEAWFNGYQQEMQAFYDSIRNGTHIESDSQLAADVISTIYTAYLSAEQGGKLIDIILTDT
ncbi:MAG: Gfo/Idh/MocA family oxidoreductase [Pedobacter sp.]|nr:MAG: Gfo/Idh/MocA family oxidoreductase [Pedobacter sp.]